MCDVEHLWVSLWICGGRNGETWTAESWTQKEIALRLYCSSRPSLDNGLNCACDCCFFPLLSSSC